MAELIHFPDGGYSFLRGGFPYSQGVKALQGYAIERVRFAQPLPVMQGFAAIEAHLSSLGRPRTALCAAELRSPAPLTIAGFKTFNEGYVEILKRWTLFRDGLNPVARSNVAPEISPPPQPCFYAFCYTVPVDHGGANFVVAGSGEWPDGGAFPGDIVARGDVSASGLTVKARFVLGKMQDRLAGLGASWRETTAVQVYTVHDIHHLLAGELLPRTGNGAGLTWHYCRPPIEELEYEMDLRGVAVERLLQT
ncbi:MAG: 2-amino-5-chloromuconate deaminase CnbZ [Betaproteobacteria bacterium]